MEHSRHPDGRETFGVPGFEITLPPARPEAGGCVGELPFPGPVGKTQEEHERARARAIIAAQAATLPADKVIGPTGQRFNPSDADRERHARQLVLDGLDATLRNARKLLRLTPDDEWTQDVVVQATALSVTGRQRPTRQAD